MTFTTISFALFLALTFALYWSVRERSTQNVLLLAASYVFYAWWDYRFCGLMLLASVIDFAAGAMIHRSPSPRVRRAWLVTSIVANLGLLGTFKYYDFFVESARAAAQSLGWTFHPVTLNVLLPVGISFYTFQTLSYTIDIYRKQSRPAGSFVDYLAFVSFFPQLVAGPIERASDLLPQFQRPRTFECAAASDGCRQMLWGFFKKLAIADRLALVVDQVYGAGPVAHFGESSGFMIVFASILFAFQIYCDFSAYSDIAIGCARLFGLQLSRNFAYPFFSQSMSELWRRWHITLLTWFRDYVFLPLGGVRGTPWIVARNVMITFLISGLWHGAAWTFVLWGALMGAASLAEPMRVATRRGRANRVPLDEPGGNRLIPSPPVALRMLRTFAIFAFGSLLFRSPSLGSTLEALQRIAGDVVDPAAYGRLIPELSQPDVIKSVVVVALLLILEWVQRRQPHPLVLDRMPQWGRWAVYTVMLWGAVLYMPNKPVTFVYFNF